MLINGAMNKLNEHFNFQKGMSTPFVLIMATIFIIFGTALINWSIMAHKNAVIKIKKVQALQVAEAGVNYYKWHLAHNFNDYKDGNTWCCNNNPALTLSNCGNVCGPYEHEYRDYNNNAVGNYSLKITPPMAGSTIFSVESIGSVIGGASSINKKITSLVGKRSLAEYSFLSYSPIWIGPSESTSGPLHSNGGIRFDGTCNSEVTSAVDTYNCAGTGHDCIGTKPGIWGAGGPDTFWKFKVPEVDFGLFTVDLNGIHTAAKGSGACNGFAADGGICYEKNPSKAGFLVKFLANAKVEIYQVDSLKAQVWYYRYETPPGCKKEAEEIQNKTLLSPAGGFNMPSNGLIFLGNDTWVEGTVNGKVTLAVADFSGNARTMINGNILYPARDGNYSFGIMSQGDILVPKYALTNLIIDATLLSQNGHVYYRQYVGCSAGSIKNSIEIYGGIISKLFWNWTWVNGGGIVTDGYTNTNTVYNNNLTFAPPPSFPTSEKIEVLSWKEE